LRGEWNAEVEPEEESAVRVRWRGESSSGDGGGGERGACGRQRQRPLHRLHAAGIAAADDDADVGARLREHLAASSTALTCLGPWANVSRRKRCARSRRWPTTKPRRDGLFPLTGGLRHPKSPAAPGRATVPARELD